MKAFTLMWLFGHYIQNNEPTQLSIVEGEISQVRRVLRLSEKTSWQTVPHEVTPWGVQQYTVLDNLHKQGRGWISKMCFLSVDQSNALNTHCPVWLTTVDCQQTVSRKTSLVTRSSMAVHLNLNNNYSSLTWHLKMECRHRSCGTAQINNWNNESL